MKLWLLFLLIVFFPVNGFGQNLKPKIDELKQISQLPAALPQRVTALAWDGEKLWVAIYMDKGRYATFNPKTKEWKADNDEEHLKILRDVTGKHASVGAMIFIGNKLWIGSAYGESMGSIDIDQWYVECIYSQMYRPTVIAAQSYSDFAYDGNYIWIAWHQTTCDLNEAPQNQLLIKMEPETGKFIEEFPLPVGKPNHMTHGLTWDGKNLWHMKDSRLSTINSANGEVIAQYTINQIKRPSSLAWDGKALWIIEFDGKLWRLPL